MKLIIFYLAFDIYYKRKITDYDYNSLIADTIRKYMLDDKVIMAAIIMKKGEGVHFTLKIVKWEWASISIAENSLFMK